MTIFATIFLKIRSSTVRTLIGQSPASRSAQIDHPDTYYYHAFGTLFHQIRANRAKIHARNFLKEAVEHALLANLKPFLKHLPNTCLLKNP
jgi:lipase chaperone LimK